MTDALASHLFCFFDEVQCLNFMKIRVAYMIFMRGYWILDSCMHIAMYNTYLYYTCTSLSIMLPVLSSRYYQNKDVDATVVFTKKKKNPNINLHYNRNRAHLLWLRALFVVTL